MKDVRHFDSMVFLQRSRTNWTLRFMCFEVLPFRVGVNKRSISTGQSDDSFGITPKWEEMFELAERVDTVRAIFGLTKCFLISINEENRLVTYLMEAQAVSEALLFRLFCPL